MTLPREIKIMTTAVSASMKASGANTENQEMKPRIFKDLLLQRNTYSNLSYQFI